MKVIIKLHSILLIWAFILMGVVGCSHLPFISKNTENVSHRGGINTSNTDVSSQLETNEQPLVENTYSANLSKSWDSVIETLQEMAIKTEVLKKNAGIIKTSPKRFNHIGFFDKTLGKSSLLYRYEIYVRKKRNFTGVRVKTIILEKSIYFRKKEINNIQISQYMQNLFFEKLNKKIRPIEY